MRQHQRVAGVAAVGLDVPGLHAAAVADHGVLAGAAPHRVVAELAELVVVAVLAEQLVVAVLAPLAVVAVTGALRDQRVRAVAAEEQVGAPDAGAGRRPDVVARDAAHDHGVRGRDVARVALLVDVVGAADDRAVELAVVAELEVGLAVAEDPVALVTMAGPVRAAHLVVLAVGLRRTDQRRRPCSACPGSAGRHRRQGRQGSADLRRAATIPPYAVTGRSPTTTSDMPVAELEVAAAVTEDEVGAVLAELHVDALAAVELVGAELGGNRPVEVVQHDSARRRDAQLAGHVVERGRRRGVELLARGRVERHARGLAHQAGVVTGEHVGALAAPQDVTGVGLVGERRAADEVVLVVVALEPVTVLVALDEVVVGVALDQVGAALAEHPVVLVVADHEVAAGDEVERRTGLLGVEQRHLAEDATRHRVDLPRARVRRVGHARDDGVVAGHHVLLAVALHLGLAVVGRVVGAGRTGERVHRRRAADQVVLAVAVVVGVLVEAEHLVLAAVALHRVVGRAAAHDVVTGATPGVVVATGRPGVVRRSRSRPR